MVVELSQEELHIVRKRAEEKTPARDHGQDFDDMKRAARPLRPHAPQAARQRTRQGLAAREQAVGRSPTLRTHQAAQTGTLSVLSTAGFSTALNALLTQSANRIDDPGGMAPG
jgi:hypothetical protein